MAPLLSNGGCHDNQFVLRRWNIIPAWNNSRLVDREKSCRPDISADCTQLSMLSAADGRCDERHCYCFCCWWSQWHKLIVRKRRWRRRRAA